MNLRCDRVPACADRELLLFFGPGSGDFKDVSGFEQRYIAQAAIQVVGKHAQHAGKQRGAHDRGLIAQRVCELNRFGIGKFLRVGGRDEGHADGLVVAKRQQRGAQPRIFIGIRQFADRARKCRQRVLEVVKSEHARDLLHEVNLPLHVQPPSRQLHGVIIAAFFRSAIRLEHKSQPAQDSFHVGSGNLLAQNAQQLRAAQLQPGALDFAGNGVGFAAQLAAGRFQNQLRHARAGQRCGAPIGAALEAMRGVGMHAEPARRLAHARRIEPGRLDQNIFGLPGDHGIEAAHNSSQPDRLAGVGDD